MGKVPPALSGFCVGTSIAFGPAAGGPAKDGGVCSNRGSLGLAARRKAQAGARLSPGNSIGGAGKSTKTFRRIGLERFCLGSRAGLGRHDQKEVASRLSLSCSALEATWTPSPIGAGLMITLQNKHTKCTY